MLILTRKLGESIRIGDDIVVKIVEVDGKHAKIGIEAPRSVSVNREEVYERIQKENKAASSVDNNSIQNIAGMLKKRDESAD